MESHNLDPCSIEAQDDRHLRNDDSKFHETTMLFLPCSCSEYPLLKFSLTLLVTRQLSREQVRHYQLKSFQQAPCID